MGIPILARRNLYIETAPRPLSLGFKASEHIMFQWVRIGPKLAKWSKSKHDQNLTSSDGGWDTSSCLANLNLFLFMFAGLDIKVCPHARGIKILFQGTLTFVATCPTGQVIFQAGHMLIFPAVYISFTGLLKNIGRAHENLCRAYIFLELNV